MFSTTFCEQSRPMGGNICFVWRGWSPERCCHCCSLICCYFCLFIFLLLWMGSCLRKWIIYETCAGQIFPQFHRLPFHSFIIPFTVLVFSLLYICLPAFAFFFFNVPKKSLLRLMSWNFSLFSFWGALALFKSLIQKSLSILAWNKSPSLFFNIEV